MHKVGVVDKIGPDGHTVHYRTQQVGNTRPHGHWTTTEDVTVLTGPIGDGRTTIMQRLISDLVNQEPTFMQEDDGEVYWLDQYGLRYRLDPDGLIPGISEEEQKWR